MKTSLHIPVFLNAFYGLIKSTNIHNFIFLETSHITEYLLRQRSNDVLKVVENVIMSFVEFISDRWWIGTPMGTKCPHGVTKLRMFSNKSGQMYK